MSRNEPGCTQMQPHKNRTKSSNFFFSVQTNMQHVPQEYLSHPLIVVWLKDAHHSALSHVLTWGFDMNEENDIQISTDKVLLQ